MIELTVFRIKVPKNIESGPISAEQLFASLHAVCKKNVRFEIVNDKGRIFFYVVFPTEFKGTVSSQLFGSYPDLELIEVNGYTNYFDKGYFFAELGLKRVDLYPIKRFTQFEDKLKRVAFDPLSGITSALADAGSGIDYCSIQLDFKPLSDRWRRVYIRCIKVLSRNVFIDSEFFKDLYSRIFISRKRYLKALFFPFYLFLRLHSIFVLFRSENRIKDLKEMTTTIHEKESSLDAAIDKVSKLLFEVKLKFVFRTDDFVLANSASKQLCGAFNQFTMPNLNGFKMSSVKRASKVSLNLFSKEQGSILNQEELSTLFHMPNIDVKTPGIDWIESRKLEPPFNLETDLQGINLIGNTNYRFTKKKVGILPDDRRRHFYVIGKTGMGKSTLLENSIYNDIIDNKGLALIDPHGDLADKVLSFIPSKRVNDVVLIDPADPKSAIGFNLLQDVDPRLRSIVCSGIISVFKKLYFESWGPRLEHILRFTILALLEFPGSTLLGVPLLLQNSKYREQVIKSVTDPVVLNFWKTEFENMQDKLRVEAISPILNKVGQFVSSPTIRNIIGQSMSTVDLEFAMNCGKIVIINLSKGKIGEDNSTLLGSLFVTKFQLDAMKRVNIPENERKDFYLYVDEFQNFATESFATILSEARKYRLNLILANQYISQMPDVVKEAVFGNVGSILSFQIGFDDAEYISKQFKEEVSPQDLVGLNKYHAYMKLLIDGMPSGTFSLCTLPPVAVENHADISKVVKVSRERYCRDISLINTKLQKWNSNYSC